MSLQTFNCLDLKVTGDEFERVLAYIELILWIGGQEFLDSLPR